MPLQLSCAFATSMATPEHVAIAEQLGYERAWLYDSPPLYPDVWVQLCRAAERTTRIGLGPGVLIPSLRHPMTAAAAIATLVDLAGEDRVTIGVGTGFTGRYALGQRPLAWKDVAEWVSVVKALLAGETAVWEGAKIRMLHAEGFGAARPIRVPFLLGVGGPKGWATASEIADGVFLAGGAGRPGEGRQVLLFSGTVLEPGEDPGSARALAAAGHRAAVLYHYWLEHDLPLDQLPQGTEWLAAYDDVPPDERHLALHDLHLVAVNERDRPFITSQVLAATGAAWTPEQLRAQLDGLEASGITEIAYQPAGPDIPRELEAFASAFR